MAFGRSNSLSLNTGATNTMFNQQNNPSQPQQSGALFGSTGNNQPPQPGGLFGNAGASKPGGLFGSTSAPSQPQQSGGLFGNLGGGTSNQQQQGGGLFGASTQQSQPQQSGGLFGASTQQSQPQQSGGLFGGALGQNQNQNQTQNQNQNQGGQSGGGLFGNLGQPQNQASSTNTGGGLFGNLGQSQSSQQPQTGGGLFGNLGGQNKPPGNSLFGGSTTQQPSTAQQPSMFGSSLFGASTSNAPVAGSLTMGQSQAQQQTVPGARIDVSNLRPTTRFSDLHDDLKKTIENIDAFIKQQESYAAQCEALMPTHSDNVTSVTPDVELINGKVDTVELALENDGREINAAKDLVTSDVADLARCIRVIENLQLPSQFHYGQSVSAGAARSRVGDEDYDVDLVGYFNRQSNSMQKTLDAFTSNITEIESHLRVIETNTIQQSQQLAAQRSGSAGASSGDAVRELADTLRGFENGILDAAGFVGACREGVNELILGRVGGGDSGRGMGNSYRSRRY